MNNIEYERVFHEIIVAEPSLKYFIESVRNIKQKSIRLRNSWLSLYRESLFKPYKDKYIRSFLPQTIYIAYKFAVFNIVNLQDAISVSCVTLVEMIDNFIYSEKRYLNTNDILAEINRELAKAFQVTEIEVPEGLFMEDNDEDRDKYYSMRINEINSDPVFEAVAHIMVGEVIAEKVLTLTEREQKIIRFRYDLKDNDGMPYEQICMKYIVSVNQVDEIEMKALRKLRHPSRSRKLRPWLYDYDISDKKTSNLWTRIRRRVRTVSGLRF